MADDGCGLGMLILCILCIGVLWGLFTFIQSGGMQLILVVAGISVVLWIVGALLGK